jgi:flavin reductase (DIM6/NTAB) family NADH-FMN oxidoreductase RutF
MSTPEEPRWSEHAPTDADAYKSLARRWASTVTVVTGRASDGTVTDGFTATAFLTVSIAPPIILVSATTASAAGELARACTAFTVNLLSASQSSLANLFASPRATRADAFERIPWRDDPVGAAVLEGSLGAYSATVRARVDAGDHVLLLGDVTRIWLARGEAGPLLYGERAYRRLGDAL